MAIDRLGPAGHLLASLRAEAIRKSGRKDTHRADAEAVGSLPREPASARDLDALRRELAEIVEGVSASDPEALKEARPRVVRAILLWEFGAGLREHGDWQPMLDTLVETLEGSEAYQAQFASLVRDLQR